jgi:hypothetical protein
VSVLAQEPVLGLESVSVLAQEPAPGLESVQELAFPWHSR